MIVIIVLIAVIAFIAYAAWAWRGATTFATQYEKFAEAQKDYILAANKPAAESNPVRREVYMLLAQVLQVDMSNDERAAMARQGIAHLDDMEGQIDAIKVEADTVLPMLSALDGASSGIGNLNGGSSMKDLVQIGRRQTDIISDIRGLSYRADYYTSEVFERIIDDGGAMTDEHKTYLNDLIPQLEEQFDKRSNLYRELKENDDSMKEIARELGYGAE